MPSQLSVEKGYILRVSFFIRCLSSEIFMQNILLIYMFILHYNSSSCRKINHNRFSKFLKRFTFQTLMKKRSERNVEEGAVKWSLHGVMWAFSLLKILSNSEKNCKMLILSENIERI